MKLPKHLYLGTKNTHKVKEVNQILQSWGIECFSLPKDISITPNENGNSFLDNALIKGKAYSEYLQGLVLADDSGLCVEALGGQPGIHSSRYSGKEGNDRKNNEKLLKELSTIENRRAYFVCSLSLCFKGKEIFRCEGKVHGEITKSLSGKNGFGYDPLFYYPPLEKTFSELSIDEKNKYSHRYKALYLLAEWIKKND